MGELLEQSQDRPRAVLIRRKSILPVRDMQVQAKLADFEKERNPAGVSSMQVDVGDDDGFGEYGGEHAQGAVNDEPGVSGAGAVAATPL